MPIRIPSQQQRPLARILALPDDAFAKLRAVVMGLRMSDGTDQVVDAVAQAVGLPRGEASAIVTTLMSMAYTVVTRGITADEFLKQVELALPTCAEETLRSLAPTPDRLRTRLRELIDPAGGLAIASKISTLSEQHERRYCESRVITDLRPVFRGPPSTPPVEFIVTHTLVVTHHADNETRDLHISLSGRGVEDLRINLRRAADKEEALRKLLTEKGLVALQEPLRHQERGS